MKNRVTYNSPVVLTYAIISFIALVLITVQPTIKTMFFSVYRSSPASLLYYVRLVGHIFGHASFSHYINNMMMILLLGPMLEERYGSKKLLVMILITAVITGFAHIIISTNTMLLGASGVVFMMVLLSSYVNIKKNEIPLTFILVFAFYMGKEIFNGITLSDHVSQLAHIGGGLAGSVFGFVFNGNSKSGISGY